MGYKFKVGDKVKFVDCEKSDRPLGLNWAREECDKKSIYIVDVINETSGNILVKGCLFMLNADQFELIKEETNKQEKMEKFSIEGSATLRRAFIEESGFKFHDNAFENYKDSHDYLSSALKVKYPKQFSGTNTKAPSHFVLPGQWNEALDYVKKYFADEVEETFNKGTWVTVTDWGTAYHKEFSSFSNTYKLRENSKNGFLPEYDYKGSTCNGFTKNFTIKMRKATPKEVTTAKSKFEPFMIDKLSMFDYEINLNPGAHTVNFGCKKFTAKEVHNFIQVIGYLNDISRGATLTENYLSLISGDKLSTQQLREIYNRIK